MTGSDVGLLDTSAVIDLDVLDLRLLPAQPANSAVTLAELAAGPQAARDPEECADLLVAAVALAEGLPLITRNHDFGGVSLIEIVEV